MDFIKIKYLELEIKNLEKKKSINYKKIRTPKELKRVWKNKARWQVKLLFCSLFLKIIIELFLTPTKYKIIFRFLSKNNLNNC